MSHGDEGWTRQLPDEPSWAWFALLDAAAMDEGRAQLRRLGFQDMVCLFDGDMERQYWHVAPYLARLPPLQPSRWAPSLHQTLDELAQRHALQLVAAPADQDLEALKRHFKRFTLAYLPDGGPALCRFYDPNVMRQMWPVWNPAQQARYLQGLHTAVLPPWQHLSTQVLRPASASTALPA